MQTWCGFRPDNLRYRQTETQTGTQTDRQTDRQTDGVRQRPLLDETSNDTERVMNGPLRLLQDQFVGATDQDGDGVARILDSRHLQTHNPRHSLSPTLSVLNQQLQLPQVRSDVCSVVNLVFLCDFNDTAQTTACRHR